MILPLRAPPKRTGFLGQTNPIDNLKERLEEIDSRPRGPGWDSTARTDIINALIGGPLSVGQTDRFLYFALHYAELQEALRDLQVHSRPFAGK